MLSIEDLSFEELSSEDLLNEETSQGKKPFKLSSEELSMETSQMKKPCRFQLLSTYALSKLPIYSSKKSLRLSHLFSNDTISQVKLDVNILGYIF